MRRGKLAGGRGCRAGGAEAARALEELVRTVVALDGPRAALLLSGLCEAVRPAALSLLRRLEQGGRAERHARLASAFAPRPALLAATGEIPGRLGNEVREALARRAAPEPARDASLLAQWARRVLLELRDR